MIFWSVSSLSCSLFKFKLFVRHKNKQCLSFFVHFVIDVLPSVMSNCTIFFISVCCLGLPHLARPLPHGLRHRHGAWPPRLPVTSEDKHLASTLLDMFALVERKISYLFRWRRLFWIRVGWLMLKLFWKASNLLAPLLFRRKSWPVSNFMTRLKNTYLGLSVDTKQAMSLKKVLSLSRMKATLVLGARRLHFLTIVFQTLFWHLPRLSANMLIVYLTHGPALSIDDNLSRQVQGSNQYEEQEVWVVLESKTPQRFCLGLEIMLKFPFQVCLAQAQECILEKSILDHRKSSIIAKVRWHHEKSPNENRT